MKEKISWRLKDIVDLEYFLHLDEAAMEETGSDERTRKDRDLYLNRIAPGFPDGLSDELSLDSRTLIRAWVEERRIIEEGDADAVLPGGLFEDIRRFLRWAAVISGLAAGAGAAFSLLSYTGTAPVNVSVYLGALVALQIGLLVLTLPVFLWRIFSPSVPRRSFLYSLVSRGIQRLMNRVIRRAGREMGASRRNSLSAAAGMIRSRKRIYGKVFFWPVFVLIQGFAAAFNFGALCATLMKVVGSDVAFGWQSTLRLGPEAVHRLAGYLAAPWSWLMPPEIAYPSLAQIEGSRMILKDGIWRLSTGDLTSWWPFLCLAVLCYGLIPRLILMLGGTAAQSSALRNLDFTHDACDGLKHRMLTPLVQTGGMPVPDAETETESGELFAPDISSLNDGNGSADLIALVPDDLFEACMDGSLEEALKGRLGYHVKEQMRIGESTEADRAVIEYLKEHFRGENVPHVLLLQEAWQPPIKEILGFIRSLREHLGEMARIRLALIGKPLPETIYTPVQDTDWRVWRQKISVLGDPYLYMERLVNDASY